MARIRKVSQMGDKYLAEVNGTTGVGHTTKYAIENAILLHLYKVILGAQDDQPKEDVVILN